MPKLTFRRVWPLFLSLFVSLSVLANRNPLFGADSNTNQDFLPVTEAFQFSGSVDQGNAVIDVRVAPGHYLYKDRFTFSPARDITQLGNATYPQGEMIHDPYFQKDMETFVHDLTITLPVDYSGSLPELEIDFQGCASAGLCYPPHKVTIPLVADAPAPKQPLPTDQGTSNAFLQQLEQSSLPVALLVFILAGIGLSLTPCVLPMFPILFSLLLGSKELGKGRTVALTLTYILTMSATFAAAGTAMGLFGATLNLQARLQSPWLLVPMAILFALLALSMFGLYELQLPGAIRDRLSNKLRQSGGLSGAVAMGLLSALVVSPCVSAPLAGALIYISATGNALFGGLTLFALGLGMGIPLFALAIGGRHWLPKSGSWMSGVRSVFGVLLLGVAIWLLERVIPAQAVLFLWGTLLLGCGVSLGAFNNSPAGFSQKLQQTTGLFCLIYAACLIVGAAMGHQNPLKPLYSDRSSSSLMEKRQDSAFTTVTTLSELHNQLNLAAQRNQPAVIDVYADWCISCKIMEQTVFPDPLVAEQLAAVALIKLDITDNTREHQQFLDQHQLFGPPALLFFDATGEELPALRSQGEVTAGKLHEKLTRLVGLTKKAPIDRT